MEGWSLDEIYSTLCDVEKLHTLKLWEKIYDLVTDMTFHHVLPYEEITKFISEEREAVLGKIPEEAMRSNNIQWEHVGSTSIKGMPGQMNPDSLILVSSYPPPRELVSALVSCNYLSLGAGPLDVHDLWFVKVIDREGSPLNKAVFVVHINPAGHGPANILMECRDLCNTESWAFEDYKSSKVEAARKLDAGDFSGYKKAKGECGLLRKLAAKHNVMPRYKQDQK